LFIGIGLWVAFAPTHKHPIQVVHVKVEAPPPSKPQVPQPQGDEQAEPSTPPPQPAPLAIVPPPHVPKGMAPEIAIVIDDVGLDLRGSERAINLPAYVTLSFMPYATRLREQTRAARDKGHELLLHMPMEPLGDADPGPDALLTSLSLDDNRLRLQTALASFVGFDGVNNHMGSKFTADRDDMAMVMDELKQRHLFFLDSRTSPQSVGYAVARAQGLPTVARDIFLDDDQSPRAIKQQLEQTEIIARRRGYAVAIGHPHEATLQVLEEWLPQAEARGYHFVPINSFIHFSEPPH